MKVVGIQFKYNPKVSYYLPKANEQYYVGQAVVVENNNEMLLAHLAIVNKDIKELKDIKEIVRIATAEDLKKEKQNKKRAEEGLAIARSKANELGLSMKILDCEISLSGRALFHFTAEDRVDFRELVRILATNLHCRIELRQISPREVVREMGGMGSCGRACCCTQGLVNVQKVSIKMAKEQGLSLNMAKLSGVCGKLKCCLSYENELYVQTMQSMPPMGAKVNTPEGEGVVIALNIPKYLVSVKLQNSNGSISKNFSAKDVQVLELANRAKGENNSNQNSK